jgi:hypothetical protein
MIFGRDGTSMVSVYMTSVAIELRMARVFQADLGILSAFLIIDDDDVFSLEPFESDILLFLLSSSNSYHAMCKNISDPPLFSMIQKLQLSDLVYVVAFFSSVFNQV